jgi:hypothetical protein
VCKSDQEVLVIVLGVVLLLLGWLLGVSILWILGLILLLVGLVLALLGGMDRAVGPRRHYW